MFTTRTAIITVQASGIEPQLVTVTQDAVTKTVTVSAGGLSSALTPEEQSIVSRLAINGTLDATDFRFMRDSIPNLEYLDIRQSGIVAYRGNMGTGGSYTISYPEATIPQHAFSINYSSNDVMALKSILLPTSITSIGGGAFEYCYKLDSIKIPDSVTSIGDFAFESCKGLKNIVLSNSLTDIGQIFGNCVSLTTVIIPNSVITIANYAFVNCSGLSTLTIPGNVSSIGSYAFSCSGLTSIVSVSTIPLSLSNYGVFSNVNKSTCILSVPTGSKVLYQAAYQWKDFLNIIEMITAVSDVTESNVSIYPNPVKETFRITGLNETAHIILTDINGKQVVNRQVGADEKIPVGELTEGIYILRIVTSDGILVRKLIKE